MDSSPPGCLAGTAESCRNNAGFLSCLHSLGLAVLVVAILALCMAPAQIHASSQLIKKSSSGICHSADSAHYKRIKTFQAFTSINECLNTGARLPKVSSSSRSPAGGQATSPEAYDRNAFGGWVDADGDCKDTRAELLVAQSTGRVSFADERRCRVVAGRWISIFTGDVIYRASDVDIDHLVSLKYAWARGASEWPPSTRVQFANDTRNLVVMERSLNRSTITI